LIFIVQNQFYKIIAPNYNFPIPFRPKEKKTVARFVMVYDPKKQVSDGTAQYCCQDALADPKFVETKDGMYMMVCNDPEHIQYWQNEIIDKLLLLEMKCRKRSFHKSKMNKLKKQKEDDEDEKPLPKKKKQFTKPIKMSRLQLEREKAAKEQLQTKHL
jgi:hypothetical protein